MGRQGAKGPNGSATTPKNGKNGKATKAVPGSSNQNRVIAGLAVLGVAVSVALQRGMIPTSWTAAAPRPDPEVAEGALLLEQGDMGAGIEALVRAQRRNLSSTDPAETLNRYRKSFHGKAPHYVTTAMKRGTERLEQVIFESLHQQGVLEGAVQEQLRLAQLAMMYHPPDDLKQASTDLALAAKILETITPPEGYEERAEDCRWLAKTWQSIISSRQRLTDELSGGATAKELAKRTQALFQTVNRVEDLSVAEYLKDYVQLHRPVVVANYGERLRLGGGAFGWDDLATMCGQMNVRVSARLRSSRHLWAGLSHLPGNRTLAQWFAEIRSGAASKDHYLMDSALPGRCDELLAKLQVPKYFSGDVWRARPLNGSTASEFFARHPTLSAGPAGSSSAIHVDSYAAAFWQVVLQGRKRFTLYALPNELRRTLLYAGLDHEIMPLVPRPGVDDASGSRGRGLRLLEVAEQFKVTVEVGPGDLLIIPGGVPHAAENLEDSVALSMNVLHQPGVPSLHEELRARACYTGETGLKLEALDSSTQESGQTDFPFSEYYSSAS